LAQEVVQTFRFISSEILPCAQMKLQKIIFIVWLRCSDCADTNKNNPDSREESGKSDCMMAKNFRQGLMPADTSTVPVSEHWCSAAALQTPNVAICLHGPARNFRHNVYATQKRNLVDSLGVDATVFLHLWEAAMNNSTSDAAIREGIQPWHMRVAEGPAGELPKCMNYVHDYKARQAATQDTPHHKTMDYLMSVVERLSYQKTCMEMIKQEEADTRYGFTTVILARADLAFYMPLKPHCMYNLAVPRRFKNWFFMVPRNWAEHAFTTLYDDFYECRKSLKLDVKAEDYELSWRGSEEDFTLPALVSREDRPDACEFFANPGGLLNDPRPEQLCEHIISSIVGLP